MKPAWPVRYVPCADKRRSGVDVCHIPFSVFHFGGFFFTSFICPPTPPLHLDPLHLLFRFNIIFSIFHFLTLTEILITLLNYCVWLVRGIIWANLILFNAVRAYIFMCIWLMQSHCAIAHNVFNRSTFTLTLTQKCIQHFVCYLVGFRIFFFFLIFSLSLALLLQFFSLCLVRVQPTEWNMFSISFTVNTHVYWVESFGSSCRVYTT